MKGFSSETYHSMEFMVISITQRENVTHVMYPADII